MASHKTDKLEVSSQISEKICRYFLISSCTKGIKCHFSHDLSFLKNDSVKKCHFYSRGLCRNGSSCRFLHVQHASKFESESSNISFSSRQPTHTKCQYFSLGFCYKEKECPFIHDDQKEQSQTSRSADIEKPICGYFMNGICRYGNYCRDAHIRVPDAGEYFHPTDQKQSSTVDKDRHFYECDKKQTTFNDCHSSTQESIATTNESSKNRDYAIEQTKMKIKQMKETTSMKQPYKEQFPDLQRIRT